MTDWKDILAGLNTTADTESAPENTDQKHHATTTGLRQSGHNDTTATKTPTLTLFYEKKGRAGKPATIITGFDINDPDALGMADTLASTLKKKIGCGGSARGGEILLQGNRITELKKLLPSLGYTKIKG